MDYRKLGLLTLFILLKAQNHEEFFSYVRLWPEQFNHLLQLITPYLRKHSIQKSLSVKARLTITLSYLAQGDTAHDKHLEFRIGKSTVYKIIPEVYWKRISEDFFVKWQFPNCIGALDGRHIEIQAPPCSGSEFYNYKGYFSIVLIAMCDANHKFTWVDIGQFGLISDGGIWSQTDLAADLETNRANLPEPTPLPKRDVPFPYIAVADEAFPLKPYLMRPFPRRADKMTNKQLVFNYRLARARLCIENTFGIFCSRWRILQRRMSCSVKTAEIICKALVCLHNFAMSANNSENQYCQPDWCDVEDEQGRIIEGQWRTVGAGQFFKQISRVGANRAGAFSIGLRNYLSDYFMSPIGNAQAPWQLQRALKGGNINLPA
ncbi:uncharacterized protein [Cardiocondyla obscurior]|uniref:uncharacterized protein n=1 Tax=Cardiocondyla obscurior TaxID=286306 RepID=UPI003965694B